VPSTITINNTNNAYSIGGSPIAGPAKLTKQGAGVLTLTSNNTLTNGVTLSAGVLRVGADGAVGSGLLTLVLGTLSSADTTAHTLTNALQINNGVTLGDSTNNGTLTLSGPLNLNGNNETLTVKSDVILSGGSTNGSIYKAGANTLTLQGGVHNWSNPILVNNGVMVLNSAYLTNSSTTELRVSSNQTNGIARLTINGGAVVLTAPGAFLRLGYSEFGNTTAGGIAGGATNILDVAGLISMPNNTNGGILIGRSSILSVVNLLTGGDLAVKNVTGSDITGNKTPWLFNFNGGTLRASVDNTTFFQPATNSTVYVQNGGAVFNTSGYNITVNQSLVEDPNSTGGGLTKNGNGILTLGGTNTYTGSTTVNQGKLVVPTTAAGSGAITVADAGSLGVNLTAAGATFSATSVTLGTSAAHNGTLDIALGGFVNPTVAPFTITSALAANGTNTINLTGTNLVLGSFPLISYPGTLGVGVFNTFKLGSLPSGIGGLLVNNTANNTIDLNITNAAVPPRQWVGNINGNWDINGTSNWLDTVSGGSAVYLENAGGNPALTFNDSASTFTVSVVANVSPGSMTVNNTTPYSIGGNPIGGTGSLLKTNAGTLTLTSSNAYSGGTTLQAGTLKLGANGALGSGVLTTSGGLLSSDSTVARTNVLAGVTFISATTLGDTNNVNTGQLVLSGKVNWNGGIRQMTVAGDVVLSGGSTNGGFVKFGTGVWTFLGGTHSLTRVATASLGDVVFDGATISNSVGQAFVVNCTQPAGLARLVLTNGANWTDYYSGIPDVYIGNTGDATATNLLELAGTFTAGPGGVARLGASCALAQVDLFNGGVLEVAGVTSTNGGASVLNFNGGTLRALADSTNFIAGLTNVYVQNGGGTIDSSSNSIIVTQPLLLGGTGGLTKAGTGLLTLDSLNTYTNTTLVSAGTLAGTGTLAGPLTVGINGSLAPGDGGVGTFTINGKLTLTAGGTNYVDINASTGTNDLVTGLTSATYAGTLVVSNLATGTPPTNGQSFQIFNAVGSPVGNFSSLTPAPATNLVWNFNPTTGVLKAVTAVVPSPVANPDFASTYWNVPVTVLALTNDTDPGSNPLTIVSVSPTNGTASIVNSTNVLFTPTNGAAGTGYVGYAITNGNGGSANSLITVTVLTPPKARITSVTRSGNNLVLNATNGAPNGIYAVLTSTNVALPLASWTPIILGGAFDASGNFTGILIPMTNGAKSFYSIKQ
jgi:autotransporter-associated beta strand protein